MSNTSTSFDLSEIHKQAVEAGKQADGCPRPDFSIPQGCDASGDMLMDIREFESKGRGFYAREDIKAGTMLLAAKPIALVMEWEEDSDDTDSSEIEEGEGVVESCRRNDLLILRIVEAIKQDPDIWLDMIDDLYPRKDDVTDLPLWVCEDASIGLNIEKSIDSLSKVTALKNAVEEIRLRLPLIVRYNCLSIETSPELFVYPNIESGGLINLSGTGLYHRPSFFNHSHKPNVSRYSIGDVMFFVTNQNVTNREELQISYIESDVLCESAKVRSALLDMDFEEGLEADDENMEQDSYSGGSPVIDISMQEELMNIHPLQRLDEIQGLLKEAQGEGSDDVYEEVSWFKCDIHQLRILLAFTYESLGLISKGLEEWKKCVTFANAYFPPGE